MIGKAAARLGKEAAEIALQFMSEGMSLDDAVRAGAKLMDEELSPAAETMLRQNQRARDRFFEMNDQKLSIGNPRSPEEAMDVVDQFYNPAILRSANRSDMKNITDFTRKNNFVPKFNRRAMRKELDFSGDIVSAANGYAIRQLLLDAAEGDEALAALLARRLGFSSVMTKPISPAAMSYLGRMP